MENGKGQVVVSAGREEAIIVLFRCRLGWNNEDKCRSETGPMSSPQWALMRFTTPP
jgi:hypothetical protein